MLQEYFLPRFSYILSHLSSVALNAGLFTLLKGSIKTTKKFVTELFKVIYPQSASAVFSAFGKCPRKGHLMHLLAC